jgi:hypothetical protein
LSTSAQSLLDIEISELECHTDLENCLKQITSQTNVQFNYKSTTVENIPVLFNLKNISVKQALDTLKNQTNIDYSIGENGSVLISPKTSGLIYIHGYIVDGVSKERVSGALMSIGGTDKTVVTNKNGYYRLYLRSSIIDILVYKEGYQTLHRNLNIADHQMYIFSLAPVSHITEVDILHSDSMQLTLKQFDEISPSENIIPSMGGETDALNNLKMLTGVQNVSFGDPGLIIRGGGPDQNFIVMDGIPVYNTFHLLGLYSIFNSSTINNIKVYKDAFPSRYSSRLSSVIDVSLNNGNKTKHEVTADLGIISSGIAMNGPIIKDKLSYSVSARRTYADILMFPIQRFLDRNEVQKNTTALWYYDFYGKLHYQVNKKNDIKLTAYNGGDQLRFNTELKLRDNLETVESTVGALGWRNNLLGLQWHSIISSKAFMTFQSTYSGYNVEFSDEYGFNQIGNSYANKSSYHNGLKELRNSVDFDLFLNNKNHLQTGGGYVQYEFIPFERNYRTLNSLSNIDTSVVSNKINSSEIFAYIEDKAYFEGGNITLGLRVARFSSQSINYLRFQPRVLLIQNLNKKHQLRFGLSSVDQFVHLVPNNNLGLPLDIWLPVTESLNPLSVTQLSSKFQSNGKKVQWGGSVFSKFYNNIVEHKSGANLLSDENWENGLLKGSGRAYGLELSMRTKLGKWSVYNGYTYCRSKRTVDGINEGAEYFSKYDRPHSLNILAEQKINKDAKVMLSFTYASGNPVSLPTARYVTLVNGQEVIVEEFDKINNFRLPASHHLDISYIKNKEYKKINTTFIIGIYNLYNQLNPFMVYIGLDEEAEPTIKIRSYLPMMPMLKYSISL